MPTLRAKIEQGTSKLGKRVFRDEVFRPSLGFVGKFWQRFKLPIHFTKKGKTLYRYKPRGGDPGSGKAFVGSYQWRKLKGYANSEGVPSLQTTRPLVYTGASEQSGKRGKVTPRAQSSGAGYVEVTIPAPALNFTPGGINLRAEVTRVADGEEREMEALLARDCEKRTDRILAKA